jgi:hypothetical protein
VEDSRSEAREWRASRHTYTRWALSVVERDGPRVIEDTVRPPQLRISHKKSIITKLKHKRIMAALCLDYLDIYSFCAMAVKRGVGIGTPRPTVPLFSALFCASIMVFLCSLK